MKEFELSISFSLYKRVGDVVVASDMVIIKDLTFVEAVRLLVDWPKMKNLENQAGNGPKG